MANNRLPPDPDHPTFCPQPRRHDPAARRLGRIAIPQYRRTARRSLVAGRPRAAYCRPLAAMRRGNAMSMHRRKLLALAGSLAAAALPRAARADSYPSRPVRIMVGYSAGGGVDLAARLIGQWLGE